MIQSLLVNEPTVRLIAFLSVLGLVAAFELVSPRRRQEIPRVIRWSNNIALVVLDTLILRMTFPVMAVGLAVIATDKQWGLFNLIDAPVWLEILLAIVLLDLAIYLQHVLFHAVPVLWRLHRMHHADLEFDATTGLRFHPIEIMLSMAIKLGVVAVIGAPAIAVLLFEIVLNATALFTHANFSLPSWLDRRVRLVMVTPDMHRVHHSVIPAETNSNYGFNLSVWDRMFGTYIADPRHGHDGMKIGLSAFRTTRDLWLDRMLVQPLVGPARIGAQKTDD